MGTSTPPLLGSDFLAKLEQLQLLARKLFRGERRAERRSRALGSSLEFADYREYVPGDELRSIDWPAYGRLDRLFVKLYEHEQDLPVSFLVDASASMRWQPDPAAPHLPTKFEAARLLTAALAYLGLANLDAVNIHYFADQLLEELGVARGKAQFHRVLNFLNQSPPPASSTNLLAVVRHFTQRVKRRGLVFVLSDFFDPAGFAEPLSLLQHAQFEVHVLQILDPAEFAPRATGDLRLVDAESGRTTEVTVNEAVLRRYQEAIAEFNQGLASFCLARGLGHAGLTSELPFEEVVLRLLRTGVMFR